MLATWLAALLFFVALQALLVVKLADRLTASDTAADNQAGGDAEEQTTTDRYARAA